jgi:hypothetical protein
MALSAQQVEGGEGDTGCAVCGAEKKLQRL